MVEELFEEEGSREEEEVEDEAEEVDERLGMNDPRRPSRVLMLR
jgi:hypothetical protein